MSPKEPVDLVIEPHWVLPIAPINTALTDHAIAVTAGRIVALAPTEQVNSRFEPRERIVRGDHALLPGFVNAHTRAATTLLRGLPVYGPRQRWMRETVMPVARGCMSPGFVREGTQLAIAEMLQAGITTFADMYLFDHLNLTKEPTVFLGMDVLGSFEVLVIDYRMREMQIRPRGRP